MKHILEDEIPQAYLMNKSLEENEMKLEEKQQRALNELLEQNQDLFATDSNPLGRTSIVKHQIPIQTETLPVR